MNPYFAFLLGWFGAALFMWAAWIAAAHQQTPEPNSAELAEMLAALARLQTPPTPTAAECSPLSPRERDGVRGKEPHARRSLLIHSNPTPKPCFAVSVPATPSALLVNSHPCNPCNPWLKAIGDCFHRNQSDVSHAKRAIRRWESDPEAALKLQTLRRLVDLHLAPPGPAHQSTNPLIH